MTSPQPRYFGPAGDDSTPRPVATQTGTSYTAGFGQLVPVDTSSGAFTVNLPLSDRVGEIAIRFAAGTNAITLLPAGSDTIDGAASSSMALTGEARIVGSDGSGGWSTMAACPPSTVFSDMIDAAITAAIGTTIQGAIDSSLTTALYDYMPLIANVHTVAASGSSMTVPDIHEHQACDITLTDDCTFIFPTQTAGKWFRMVIRQDAVGGHTITWPANALFPIGAFNLTVEPLAVDSVLCMSAREGYWGVVLEGKDYG